MFGPLEGQLGARIVSARAIDDATLMIEFYDGDRKIYGVVKLLKKLMFTSLRRPSFLEILRLIMAGTGLFGMRKLV